MIKIPFRRKEASKTTEIKNEIRYGEEDSEKILVLDSSTLSHLENINSEIITLLDENEKGVLNTQKDIFGLHKRLIEIIMKYKQHLVDLKNIEDKESETEGLKKRIGGGTASDADIQKLTEISNKLKLVGKNTDVIKKDIKDDEKEIDIILSLLKKKISYLTSKKDSDIDSLNEYKKWLNDEKNGAISIFNDVKTKLNTSKP